MNRLCLPDEIRAARRFQTAREILYALLVGLLMAAGAVAIIKLDQRQEAQWEEGR